MTDIILKRNTSTGNSPTGSDLAVGELAINTADQKLYSKHSNGTVFAVPGIVSVTSIAFTTSAGASKSLEAELTGPISGTFSNIYIPFVNSSGTSFTTLKLV